MMRTMMSGVLALMLSGCSLWQGGQIPTERYGVSLELQGAITVPPVSLAEINVPVGSSGLFQLALVLARPYLEEGHNLRTCRFGQAAEVAREGRITIAATAQCVLYGVPVNETLVLEFTPRTAA